MILAVEAALSFIALLGCLAGLGRLLPRVDLRVVVTCGRGVAAPLPFGLLRPQVTARWTQDAARRQAAAVHPRRVAVLDQRQVERFLPALAPPGDVPGAASPVVEFAGLLPDRAVLVHPPAGELHVRVPVARITLALCRGRIVDCPFERSRLPIPFVGVGCIVERAGKFLLARNHGGWDPPGGHLDFGEDPATCAARETREETGVRVTNVEFVALTNDLLAASGKHYVTIWMRGESEDSAACVADPKEIAEVGWFAQSEFPQPLAEYFKNLLARRCLPPAPANLPFAAVDAAAL